MTEGLGNDDGINREMALWNQGIGLFAFFGGMFLVGNFAGVSAGHFGREAFRSSLSLSGNHGCGA